jgi:WD40 repeat protein
MVLASTGASGWTVGFSADGHRIAWSTVPHGGANQLCRLEYQLQLPAGGRPLGRSEPNFVHRRTTFGDYALSHRKGGAYGYNAVLDLIQGDEVVTSIERGATDGYDHRAYSFTPDGQTIISGGSNGWLIAYDLKDQRLGDFVGHESDIWAVTPSPDGRFLVSGSVDQTVRPVEPQNPQSDRHPVQRHRRRMGDVDAAGLLHGFTRRRQDRRLADQRGTRSGG